MAKTELQEKLEHLKVVGLSPKSTLHGVFELREILTDKDIAQIISCFREMLPEKKHVNHASHLHPETMMTLEEITGYNTAIEELERKLGSSDG